MAARACVCEREKKKKNEEKGGARKKKKEEEGGGARAKALCSQAKTKKNDQNIRARRSEASRVTIPRPTTRLPGLCLLTHNCEGGTRDQRAERAGYRARKERVEIVRSLSRERVDGRRRKKTKSSHICSRDDTLLLHLLLPLLPRPEREADSSSSPARRGEGRLHLCLGECDEERRRKKKRRTRVERALATTRDK